MEINTIGNNGYAAKGLDGLQGDSGKSIHFSAYDLVDPNDREVAKKLIMSGKALSTNPDLQTPEVYEDGDTLLTVYGEFYTIKSISSSDVEISSAIAEFFPNNNKKLEDDKLTFELNVATSLDEAAGSEATYYNTYRPSSNYYYNHNSSPFIKVQKNVGSLTVPAAWGNHMTFTEQSVENLKKIFTEPEYKPYVKISLIFKCGLTKEIIYTSISDISNTKGEIFIENEYIHMCGFMTCEGNRSIPLNDQYLKNATDASIYYNGLSDKLNELKYKNQDYSDNGNNKNGSNYSYPLIFGHNIEGDGKIDPKKAMCTAFVEYYKNGKLRTKKINIV